MKKAIILALLALAGCAHGPTAEQTAHSEASSLCNPNGGTLSEKQQREYQKCLQDAYPEMLSVYKQEEIADRQRRSAAISSMRFDPPQQQPIPAWTPPRPTRTNCTQTFGGMNCTSY